MGLAKEEDTGGVGKKNLPEEYQEQRSGWTIGRQQDLGMGGRNDNHRVERKQASEVTLPPSLHLFLICPGEPTDSTHRAQGANTLLSGVACYCHISHLLSNQNFTLLWLLIFFYQIKYQVPCGTTKQSWKVINIQCLVCTGILCPEAVIITDLEQNLEPKDII